ncbi:MAG: ParB/RepB/Spo0J family partition protein [Sphingobacteriales bacterium]|jgi:ParB/RepB/Spo0J family partition protein|nr:ParB/RepB/Spo0J family partition protein [Sphingobacteriales bacterium]
MQINQLYDVSLADIQLKGINVRSDLKSPNSQQNLKELAESIQTNGLMQPIVLSGNYGKPPYDVIVGQRRFLAHQLLQLPTIKATFTGDIDPIEALVLSLSENMLRQELNHTDIMNAVTRLYEHFDKDEQKVKQKLGLSIKAIRGYIKVEAQATAKIKQLLDSQKITLQDAKRAIDAAQGNTEKADILIDQLKLMTRISKIRAVDYGKSNPNATVKEIIEKAQNPRIEETVILNLPFKVANALKKAVDNTSLDQELIILNALKDWLSTNDYLTE